MVQRDHGGRSEILKTTYWEWCFRIAVEGHSRQTFSLNGLENLAPNPYEKKKTTLEIESVVYACKRYYYHHTFLG